ncbi:MAG: sugar ABC transporter permease [Propionicimonas sp.]|uniref:carbohydrate ABC transporter permease n=1 Tax=Propionicimonas sp. TaxID=1955623 RepID=UPI002B1FB872|nr:sugar ABC transporter permease [Propionicimonas sp.]MEA4943823.1 sugar ABC transporter permease [Propionicimonas sp.]MEA5052084.1 sugar ABC transporter permease [Propionicimonas sp.]
MTIVFMVYPFLLSVPTAMQNWPGFGDAVWVGWRNFERLARDPDAVAALGRTFLYTAGETIGTVGIGLILAVAFHHRIPLTRALKFLAFLPVILPPTFIALAWRQALDPNFGWLTHMLAAVNAEWGRSWLDDPSASLPIVIVVGVLQYAGIPMVLFLSALGDIPQEINEAATLDGVSGWQRMIHVTIPLIRDVLIIVVGLQMVANFKFLDSVWALTRGASGSDILPTFIYRQAFSSSDFGYASAAAIVTTGVILVVSMTYTFFFRPSRMDRL